MPAKPDKPYRIRARTLDGKTREWKKLKGQLGSFFDVIDARGAVEFIICAVNEKQIEQARAKLQGAGLEAIDGGDTAIGKLPEAKPAPSQRGRGYQEPSGGQAGRAPADNAQKLPSKPFGFVSLPGELTTAAPIWHDGTSSKGRLSGEIRYELETLTPFLVGWERGQVGDSESDWPVPASLAGTQLVKKKPVLCPLRAPWGKRPVIIPGESLKGLLRHELGALLGAPMERVAERTYSYRPNALYPIRPENRFLVPRLARVLTGHVETKSLDGVHQARVPTRLELYPATLEYNKKTGKLDYRFDQQGGAPYRGGQGAGKKLNSRPQVHTSLRMVGATGTETIDVPEAARDGFVATVRHLADLEHGHFAERHPDVPRRDGIKESVDGEEARKRILKAVGTEVFQPGDFIWVEWDAEHRNEDDSKGRIVSLGWHYYYRWAYTNSVRKNAGAPRLERRGLFPLEKEREQDKDGAPLELSAVRRLLGYTGDNEGSAGIGANDHAQLMGRVFVNAGLEVVGEHDTDEQRFLGPTFLKELGMPRPSAVEHYLKQPHYPQSRPSDNATLVTYGDAAGYDAPGELAGRKFYLDRQADSAAWEDASDQNKQNERSTLALEASRPERKFRFTVRFRDLDTAELAAILVALSPDQHKTALGGTHQQGYCSKLGYARPLAWGSVRIEARQLLLLDEAEAKPTMKPESDLVEWVTKHHQKTQTGGDWLEIHCREHPSAADYPRARDRDGNENIFTFHTNLRAQHSRARRYKRTS